MSSEKIIVYIDQEQLKAQQANNYSLFLAKKVNGTFTVIWQSLGPIAKVGHASYEYKNTFIIQVPSYQVNYGTIQPSSGGISFASAGEAANINVGQTVILSPGGEFATPKNDGTDGTITIHNQLAANPKEMLADDKGNPIFFNNSSGMDIGDADLTPVDEYQIWFDNFQSTGTMIAHNASTPALVVFDGGEDSKTITYTAEGKWVTGAPSLLRRTEAEALGGGTVVIVAATFTTALTAAAVAYLTNQLVSKFAGDLRPSSIKTSVGSFKLEVTFQKSSAGAFDVEGTTRYEDAVEAALKAARNDKNSGLANEHWALSQPQLEVRV